MEKYPSNDKIGHKKLISIKKVKNMAISENIELRLILNQEDPLYQAFSDIKRSLGIKSNSEVVRFIIKQISKIPISTLILDFTDKNKG